jgi:hypothetical protein
VPVTVKPKEEPGVGKVPAGLVKPERETATPSDTSSPARAGAKSGLVGPKSPSLYSFRDLVHAVYGAKGRRLKPKKVEIAAMRSAAKLEPSEPEDLLHLSASDRTLKQTLELMLLSMEWHDRFGGEIWKFVHEVLRRHPAFLPEPLVGGMANLLDGPSEEDAVRTVTSRPYASLPWPAGSAEMRRKEIEQCRTNALWCLLLWFRRTRGTTLERIQGYLQTSIWAPAAHRYKTDQQKLRALVDASDFGGIAVACSALEKEALERARQAAVANSAADRAAARARELENKLSGTEAQLGAAKGQVERLSEATIAARSAHEDEIAHMRSDYEELRARVQGRLREEVSLLDEGLRALRRDPPKVHVMEDHAERVIDGLKSEMERLKKDDLK